MSDDVIDEIRAERIRQISQEGWTAQHDDRHHQHGELSWAAACYCLHAGNEVSPSFVGYWSPPPSHWPFEERWWKPKTVRRDLVRAAALIVAEIERLDRESQKPPESR